MSHYDKITGLSRHVKGLQDEARANGDYTAYLTYLAAWCEVGYLMTKEGGRGTK